MAHGVYCYYYYFLLQGIHRNRSSFLTYYTYKALQLVLPPTLYYSAAVIQGAMLAGREDKSFFNRPIGTEFYLTFP